MKKNERAENMSLREYFAAHAPVEPQGWFVPITDVAADAPGAVRLEAFHTARLVQWPWAWADAVLAAREREK